MVMESDTVLQLAQMRRLHKEFAGQRVTLGHPCGLLTLPDSHLHYRTSSLLIFEPGIMVQPDMNSLWFVSSEKLRPLSFVFIACLTPLQQFPIDGVTIGLTTKTRPFEEL